MDITTLIRPDIKAMEPYAPVVPFEVLSARLGRAPDGIVKLDANENPYGPSPRVKAALAGLPFPHIYPDPESTALRAAIARDTGLPMANLLAGSGADELIDLVMRLFLQPGEAIVDCPPTFGMYSFDAAVNAARVVRVPRRADFSIDLVALEAIFANQASSITNYPLPLTGFPKLIFLTSPNNPDGSVISDDDLRRVLRLPAGVVLDEAYVEFHGLSRLGWALEFENLMVLRTFSKRAGLAGLRVGYGAFPSSLMPHLWKIKQPYNVSVAASAAAIAALKDAGYMAAVVARLIAERGRLSQLLSTLGWLKVYPSRANFLLCRVLGRDALAVNQALQARGIMVRYFNRPGLTDCIRISVGRPEHTDALLDALRQL